MTQNTLTTARGPCHVALTSAVSLSLTGMVIRPKADETYEIVYNIHDTESWDMYAQALDKFLGRKSDSPVLKKSLLLWIIQPSRPNCFLFFLPNKR